MQDILLENILQIEDTNELMSICCPDTGIPMWVTVRHALLSFALGDYLYKSSVVNMGGRISSGSKFKALSVISKSCAYNFYKAPDYNKNYPILIMSTGARLLIKEGKYFNSLCDHFVQSKPDYTYTIEDLFGWSWPFPREYKQMLIHTPLRVEGELKGRIRASRYRESARALVDLVNQRAKNLLDWNIGEDRCKWLENRCAIGSASLLPRYQKFLKIFKKMGARLLIKEEACYGGADNAAAILAARHLGIITAEYQHGAISSGHLAYNFARTVSANQDYRKILPDYFFVYGSWWGGQINAPVQKITIGNPHRSEILAVDGSKNTEIRRILILGDGLETAVYLALCEKLSVALGSTSKVVFRPHPLERSKVLADYPKGSVGNILVDSNQDIYSSFQEASAVVSEVSTGLFEAIGLVPKVFIWDTPKARFSYPAHPFQRFSDVSELARLILDESAGFVNSQQIDSIWAPNWKSNYLEFIEKVIE